MLVPAMTAIPRAIRSGTSYNYGLSRFSFLPIMVIREPWPQKEYLMLKKIIYLCSMILALSLMSCGSDKDEPASGSSKAESKLKGAWWLKTDIKIQVDENGEERTLWTDRSRDYIFIFGDNGLMAYCFVNGDRGWAYGINKFNYDGVTNQIEILGWNSYYKKDQLDDIYKIESISKSELVLTDVNDEWYEESGKKYRNYHKMTFEKINDQTAYEKLNVTEITWEYGYKTY